LVHSVVDLLLGGRRSAGVEGRALTAIELGLAERMLALLVEDFDEAFTPVAEARFSLDRVETTPRFAAIAQDASVCALAKFKIRIEDMTTKAMLLAPYAMIEPVREKLLCDFIGESGAADEIWRKRLGTGVSAAGVELAAVLADRQMTIGDLRALKPGGTVIFAANVGARVELRAGDLAVAQGRVGRMGELIAVKIDATLAKAERDEETEAAA
ncbi:MAG TPA: FliM/FliN family flagellar motor switch protein, partial [Parvularculaceae bacterium]|nr:FliM/FliN family flagellar motor switch protein [Parvularculaceae bacterium]